jgi:ribonuclease Z
MLLSKHQEWKRYYLDDGQLIRNEQLTYDPPAPMSYAFCSDTSIMKK